MSDAGRFWAQARMPLLIVLVAIVAAGMVATALLMPPRRAAADLPGITTADGSAGALVVTSVKSGSQADRAGISVGDTIVGLDGQRITSRAAALRNKGLRNQTGPGIDMQVTHNHAIRHVTLRRGED